jgi:hypothetical protein
MQMIGKSCGGSAVVIAERSIRPGTSWLEKTDNFPGGWFAWASTDPKSLTTFRVDA